MPELPEVETIARALRRAQDDLPLPDNRPGPSLLGRTLLGWQLFWPRTLATPLEDMAERLAGQVVTGIGRRGKFLIIRLSRDTLIFHLRMSGDLRLEPDRDEEGNLLPPLPHDRAIFSVEGGLRLAFNDARKFGRIWFTAHPDALLSGLGPEPLDPDLTPAEFHRRLASRRRQLKPLLLDQSFLCGLGNIYTDESLHIARLHPLALSDQLTLDDATRLLEAIRAALAEGIRRNGASIDWVYRGGSMQDTFRVYRRTGKPCPVCATPIERILVGQRSTHYCPTCQTIPPSRGEAS